MMDFILSCDWGTSSFRMRLAEVNQRKIVSEVLSDRGAGYMHESWNKTGKSLDIQSFYVNELQRNIELLEERTSFSLSGIAIVISGMASSSIGMYEVPYAALPFSLETNPISVKCIRSTEQFPHNLFLVSGLCSPQDVMRGEETQIIGLAAIDPSLFKGNDILCILPGTHSKHVYIRKGVIVDFKTYMTGELFHILSHYGILKEAIVIPERPAILEPPQIDAFCQGIRDAKKGDLLHMLFNVRVNTLFKKLVREDNYYYLSGLLIGTELEQVLMASVERVCFCLDSNTYPFYALAIAKMNFRNRATIIEKEVMDRAVVEGHIGIFIDQLAK